MNQEAWEAKNTSNLMARKIISLLRNGDLAPKGFGLMYFDERFLQSASVMRLRAHLSRLTEGGFQELLQRLLNGSYVEIIVFSNRISESPAFTHGESLEWLILTTKGCALSAEDLDKLFPVAETNLEHVGVKQRKRIGFDSVNSSLIVGELKLPVPKEHRGRNTHAYYIAKGLFEKNEEVSIPMELNSDELWELLIPVVAEVGGVWSDLSDKQKARIRGNARDCAVKINKIYRDAFGTDLLVIARRSSGKKV